MCESRNKVLQVRECPACMSRDAVHSGELNGYSLVRCEKCKLVYTAVAPTEEQLVQVYNQVYQNSEIYTTKLTRLKAIIADGQSRQGFYRNQIFFKRVIPRVGDRLLEVGCGAGDFLIAAKKGGWEVEGIDLSSTAIEASVRLHGLPVRQGKLEDLDFDKHSYKAVVCWEVLEHLVYPWRFLQKIKEVLTPDGIFACSIPNNGPRVPCFRDGPLGIASVPPIHLNFWDCNSFRFFAELNDFKVLYLAPKRSLLDQVGWRNHLVRFMWNQLLAVCGLKEGMSIFALLTPNKN